MAEHQVGECKAARDERHRDGRERGLATGESAEQLPDDHCEDDCRDQAPDEHPVGGREGLLLGALLHEHRTGDGVADDRHDRCGEDGVAHTLVLETGGHHDHQDRETDHGEDVDRQADGGAAEPFDRIHVDENRADGGEDGSERDDATLPAATERRGEDQGDHCGGYHNGLGTQRPLWEPVVELDGCVVLEEHGEPEDGEGEEHEGHEGHAVVEARVLADGAHDTERDADEDREERGDDDESKRRRGRLEHEGRDVLPIAAGTEVALTDEASAYTGQPSQIPGVPRKVQAHVGRTLRHAVLTVGVIGFTEILQRVAGIDHQHVEQQRSQEQDQDRLPQSFRDVLEHLSPSGELLGGASTLAAAMHRGRYYDRTVEARKSGRKTPRNRAGGPKDHPPCPAESQLPDIRMLQPTGKRSKPRSTGSSWDGRSGGWRRNRQRPGLRRAADRTGCPTVPSR